MKHEEMMELLVNTGSYLSGHFKLSSGLHSGAYLQCALLLQNPIIAARVSGALAQKFGDIAPDVVVGPAMGGIILAYEMARAMRSLAVFTERDDEGKMTLRRGFEIPPDSKVLIAEDVLTTGKSIKEVIEVLKKHNVRPAGIACIIDRSSELIDFGGIRHESLIKFNIPTFQEKDCPLCKEGVPLVKPGSRKQR